MERRCIAVQGTVQGVGFRPFVYGLAARLHLSGFVTNSGGAVRIEVEGETPQLDQFLSALTVSAPPLARIDDVNWERRPIRGDVDFHIEPSVADPAGNVLISPDVATCDACLAELFDPRNRRYRYPFLNCTHCGPRLTIVTGAPYDRERTTMARFSLCPACQAEYEDPANRRFHAQPTACADCGPRLLAHDSRGQEIPIADPLGWFIESLRGGQIGAMKGLGGYHLVCDAKNAAAVAELRRRKHRDEKPFAVMVANLAEVDAFCEIDPAERALLASNRRPIVLLRKRNGVGLPEAIAPGNPLLGVMLPYTPLHHLLMHDINTPLVMTSGNRADEPIATGEPQVFERLAGIADVFLAHNRPIHVRCDDSVTRVMAGGESPLRRSRGYAPQALPLPVRCQMPMLAVGGQLKGTFALGRGNQAIISHHLGDLDHFEAYRTFEKDIALYEQLFAIRPRAIVHDLHPDYAATRYAQKRAAAEGIAIIPVQHHHAHMASCMAEHGLDEPVIGVSFDGTGYGADGAIWGGEFLVGDFGGFRRFAHLRYVPMPGGDKAAREPWRMALAYLADAEVDCPAWRARMEPAALRAVGQMMEKRFNTPMTSSAGRLFDAVASLVGLRDRVSFEGQAAMQLEWLAKEGESDGVYPFDFVAGGEMNVRIAPSAQHGPGAGDTRLDAAGPMVYCASSAQHGRDSGDTNPVASPAPAAGGIASIPWEPIQLDARPMIRAIVQECAAGVSSAIIARRFHATLAAMIVQTCEKMRAVIGITRVVLSGGVFMNALLTEQVEELLTKSVFLPFHHCRVPTNDGGISLGQLCIAARRLGDTSCA